MAASLSDQHCVPCHGGVPSLSPEEMAPLLAQLDGWRVEEQKKLVKAFKFPDFLGAVRFVDQVTPVAEEQGHHPDLDVRGGEVRVFLWTHAIDGLTESDFVMAAKIDRVASANT